MNPTPRHLDARGLACPQPVILTRKALAEGGFDLLEVLVDNPASRDNVVRFARHAGCEAESTDEPGGLSRIRIRPGEGQALPEPEPICGTPDLPQGIATVLIASNTLGRGSDELGALLMRGFLYTLTESERVPRRLVLMNSGVLLAIAGSEHLVNLRRLADLGVEILACGTCLEFHQARERLAAGRISNMQEIAELLLQGGVLSL